jgi:hypothetical protein
VKDSRLIAAKHLLSQVIIETTLPAAGGLRRRDDPAALAHAERVRGLVDARVDELLRELREPPG